MISTKHFITGIAASAFVTVVGLAYAQTTEGTTPATTTESGQVQPNVAPPATDMSSTPGSTGSDAMTTTTAEPAPQADRN